jgi:hypothetical protein
MFIKRKSGVNEFEIYNTKNSELLCLFAKRMLMLNTRVRM